MQTKTKRFLQIAFIVAVISMLSIVNAFAVEVITANGRYDLAALLTRDEDAHIVLGKDYMGEMSSFTVRGNKTLDLNGHNIKRYINRDDLAPTGYMFDITKGSTLTVTDSVGGGEILFYSSELEKFMRELGSNPPVRDIFHVNGGTLIVNGGEFYCGNSQEFYMTHLFRWDSDIFDQFFRDREFVYYQSGGSVVTLKNGGTFVANSGTFHGRGFETAGYTYANSGVQGAPYNGRVGNFVRHSTIKAVGEGNKAYINGGSFAGKGGADIFGIDTSKNTLKVRGGEFILHKFTNLFIYSYATDEEVEEDDRYEYYHKLTKGSINLPAEAWDDNVAERMMVETDGMTYYTKDKVQAALESFASSSVDSKITANPLFPESRQLTVNGEYADEIFWNPMGEDVSVCCNIEPYYLKSETIPGYNIWYNWYIRKPGDSVAKAINAKPSKSNTMSLANWGSHYAFPGWNTSETWITWCEIVENGPSGNLIYESKPITLKVSYLPQEEIYLPGEEFKMTAVYSKGGYSATVKILPSPDQLMPKNGIKYADKVSYRFVYKDAYGDQHDVTTGSNSIKIENIPKGDSAIDITMRLEDKYGNVKEFSKTEWLVRIPSITVTGDAVYSGESVYTVKEGDFALLNATFGEDYPGLDYTDVKGWYSAGLGDFYGTGPSYHPTQNGTYYYACWNKTKTNFVTSPNVIINFVDFSMNVSRSASCIYYYDAPSSGYDTKESVLSVELGDSFTGGNPYVLWRLINHPNDAEKGIKSHAIAGTQVNFTEFLDDTDNAVMPGMYYFQPEVTYTGPTGKRLTIYGKTVGVEVYKFANTVDITYNGTVVEDCITIESAYAPIDLSYFVPDNASYNNVKVWWEIEQDAPYGADPVYEVEYSDRGGSYGTGYYYRKATITPLRAGRIRITMRSGVNHTVGGYKGCLSDYDNDAPEFMRTIYINFPMNSFDVNFEEPVIGGSMDAFIDESNEAYTVSGYWENDTPFTTFQKGMVPKAHVTITPKPGFVFDVMNIGEENDPCYVIDPQYLYINLNGRYTSLSDKALESVSLNGEHYGSYDSIAYGSIMDIQFVYAPGQLVPEGGEIRRMSNVDFTIPTAGDVIDNDNRDWHMAIFDSVSDGVTVFEDAVEEVCHNAYLDSNPYNDEAVELEQGAKYEEGKYYRLSVKLEAQQNNVLGKDFVTCINGIQAVNTFEYGRDDVWCYMYFTPKPLIEELNAYFDVPAGCAWPIDKYDLDISGGAYADEVYWYIDTNENGVMDISEGEGGAGQFNADGSFKCNEKYSIMIVMGIPDEDEDGVGDDADLSDNVRMFIETNGGDTVEMNVTKTDEVSLYAVYTFEEAAAPEYAFVADTTGMTFNMVEGNHLSAQPQVFNVQSAGANEIDADQIMIMGETGFFSVEKNGTAFTVRPREDADYLEPGEYISSVIVYYSDENTYVSSSLELTLIVEEAFFDVRSSANRLDFDALEGYFTVAPQSFTLENVGSTPLDLTPSGMTAICRSSEFSIAHVGDKITVVPAQGLKEGVYETVIMIRSNDYAEVTLYVDVTFTVGEKPIVYGDVNDDGMVTVTDVIKILQYLASPENTVLGPKA